MRNPRVKHRGFGCTKRAQGMPTLRCLENEAGAAQMVKEANTRYQETASRRGASEMIATR